MPIRLSSLRLSHTEIPQLLEAARYGDTYAYEELLHRCYAPAKRYCSVMGSIDEADDLVQETFLRAMKCTVKINKILNLEAFVIHIARWVCADYIREKKLVRNLQTNFSYIHDVQSVHDVQDESTYEDILCVLEEDFREAFVLTQILDFSYQESSEIIGVPVGTIRSRVSRARSQLQQHVNNKIKIS